MWLRKQSVELLDAWLRHSPCMMLASGPNGEIYWANDAFCSWTKYTVSELSGIGWKKLSVDNEDLKADISSMMDVLDGYRQAYTCQKQYTPKNDKPQWGNLTVIRHPAVGDVECFLCIFEPLKNGTATAFALAMQHIEGCKTEMSGLAKSVSKLTSVNEDEDWVLKTVRLLKRYPRLALFILMIMLSVFGANNVLELVQRLYKVGVPVPQSIQRTDSLQEQAM